MAFVLSSCTAPLSDVTISPLDFGAVEPHHVHHGTVRVTNVGTSPARLIRIERRSGPESMSVTPTQVGFAAGDETTWNVTFTAADEGEVEANFVAVFDTGSASFTVRALVAPPCAVEPFDVGETRVGGVVTRTFTITNPLPRPASVRVGASEAPFSVEGAGTIRLAPNERRELTVRFSPAFEGLVERAWHVAPRTDCTGASTMLRGHAVEPLSFQPGRLRFGPGEATRTVSLRNRSRAPVRVLSAAIDSTQFELVTPLPLELPANGAASLVVRARPSSLDVHAATLTLSTDTSLQTTVELPLLLNFTGPCLSATPTRLDFGAVELDCRGPLTLTVANRCPHAVRLSSSQMPPGVALISTNGSSLIDARSTRQLAFSFAPLVESPVSGAVSLDVDVLDGTERLELPTAARALPRSRVEETSLVPGTLHPRVDVLIVLDDSPRMLQHARRVGENFAIFGRYLQANEFDARVAVMTTSTTAGVVGHLRQTDAGTSWLEAPSSTTVEELARVRGEGTGRSSCLEALQAAFSEPLRSDPTQLGGFLRSDTALSVICVTNRPDEIERPPMEAIAAVRNAMPKVRTFNVVAPFVSVSGCDGSQEDGPLRAFAMLESGTIEEFCTPNWAVALGRLGRNHFFGYFTNVRVEGRPAFARGPLQILLDGQDIPPVDPEPNLMTRIWTWNDILNAIQFEPLYVPVPGTRVTVRYTPDCPR